MKAIYFADPTDDLQDERERIENRLRENGIDLKIKEMDVPPDDIKYDIMFFDWGGMSMGNSILECFCERWIEEAQEHPSRIYVMTSEFTRLAMEDAMESLSRENDPPANVFLSIDSALPYLKALLKVR